MTKSIKKYLFDIKTAIHSIEEYVESVPVFLTKKFGYGRGVRKMVAETYLRTLSKPFFGQRRTETNFAALDRVCY